jgi:hypothetical protein
MINHSRIENATKCHQYDGVRLWKSGFIFILLAFGLGVLTGNLQADTQKWISHGPEGGGVYSLAIDPQTPATMYAGLYGGGVCKSVDGGTSWRVINIGITANPPYVRALAIDPQNPSRIYAGTYGGGVFIYCPLNAGERGQWHRTASPALVERALQRDGDR